MTCHALIVQYLICFFIFHGTECLCPPHFHVSLCSINTVYYMAPFATMILGLPAFLLERNGILDWFEAHPSPWSALIILFNSGVLAFCLNFSIFYVIQSTTAVTFNVAGNLKVNEQIPNHITLIFIF